MTFAAVYIFIYTCLIFEAKTLRKSTFMPQALHPTFSFLGHFLNFHFLNFQILSAIPPISDLLTMDSNDEETDDGLHEATSLLSRRQHVEHLTDSHIHQTSCTWPWINVVVLCIAVAIASDIGDYLLLAPRLRLYESVVCARYYLLVDPSLVDKNGFVLEEYCKVDAVQDEVAMIFGWQVFFDSVPGILLPVPYGFLADKYGRKWITVLAMTGYSMSFIWTLFMVGFDAVNYCLIILLADYGFKDRDFAFAFAICLAIFALLPYRWRSRSCHDYGIHYCCRRRAPGKKVRNPDLMPFLLMWRLPFLFSYETDRAVA
jgi:hypothetical protein